MDFTRYSNIYMSFIKVDILKAKICKNKRREYGQCAVSKEASNLSQSHLNSKNTYTEVHI